MFDKLPELKDKWKQLVHKIEDTLKPSKREEEKCASVIGTILTANTPQKFEAGVREIIAPFQHEIESFRHTNQRFLKEIRENPNFSWAKKKKEGKSLHGKEETLFKNEWDGFRRAAVQKALEGTKTIFESIGRPFPDTRASGTPGMYSDADYMIREVEFESLGFQNEEDLQLAKILMEQILLAILQKPPEKNLETGFFVRHNGNLNSYERLHSINDDQNQALVHYRWIERLGGLFQAAVSFASDGIATFDPNNSDWKNYLQIERSTLDRMEQAQFDRDVEYVESYMKSQLEPQRKALTQDWMENHPECASEEEAFTYIQGHVHDPSVEAEIQKFLINYRAPRQLQIAKELREVGEKIQRVEKKLEKLLSKKTAHSSHARQEEQLKKEVAQLQIQGIALCLSRLTTFPGGYFTEGAFITIVLAKGGQMHERIQEKAALLAHSGALPLFRVSHILPEASLWHWVGGTRENFVLTLHEWNRHYDAYLERSKTGRLTDQEMLATVYETSIDISKYLSRTVQGLLEIIQKKKRESLLELKKQAEVLSRQTTQLSEEAPAALISPKKREEIQAEKEAGTAKLLAIEYEISRIESECFSLEGKLRRLQIFAMDALRVKREQYIPRDEALLYFEAALNLEEIGVQHIHRRVKNLSPSSVKGQNVKALKQSFVDSLEEILLQEGVLTQGEEHAGWNDLKERLLNLPIQGRGRKRKTGRASAKKGSRSEQIFSAMKKVVYEEFPEMTKERKQAAINAFDKMYDAGLAPDPNRATVQSLVDRHEALGYFLGKVSSHRGYRSTSIPQEEEIRSSEKQLSEEHLLRGSKVSPVRSLVVSMSPQEPALRGGFWFRETLGILEASLGTAQKGREAHLFQRRYSGNMLFKHNIVNMEELNEKMEGLKQLYREVMKLAAEGGNTISHVDEEMERGLPHKFPIL